MTFPVLDDSIRGRLSNEPNRDGGERKKLAIHLKNWALDVKHAGCHDQGIEEERESRMSNDRECFPI